jgi:hypothetical protein
MRWGTRTHIHIDRAASAWLIRRFIDPEAVFVFVDDPADLDEDVVAFDMRGVKFGHRGDDCTFETLLREHELLDPALWRIATIVHEADLGDDKFDAPEAPGIDVALRGLSMVCTDEATLTVTKPLFDGLYEFFHRELLLGKEPS